jgi:integrase
MSVRYSLHRPNAGNPNRALRLRVYRNKRQLVFPVKAIKVDAQHWSQTRQGLKTRVPGAIELNAQLDRLRNEITALCLEYPDDEALEAAVRERLGLADKEPERSLLDLYKDFLGHKRARTKASTMQTYESLQNHLQTWLPEGFTVRTIGPKFVEDFQTYCVTEGMASSTVNKLARRLQGFLGWLSDGEIIEAAPKAKPLTTARSEVVTLTLAELNALQRIDLSGHQRGYSAARDLFVFGAMTGLRFSDLQGLTWDQVRENALFLHERKTGHWKQIPLAGPARAIIEARRGEDKPLPVLSNQKSNTYLRDVAKLAGITAIVTERTAKGGNVETRTVAKHEVLSMHDARRTFVTLLLEAGMSTKELLGVSHSDLRSLQLYAGSSNAQLQKAITVAFG